MSMRGAKKTIHADPPHGAEPRSNSLGGLGGDVCLQFRSWCEATPLCLALGVPK